MSTVETHIRSIDQVVTQNIERFREDRGLLSQNLLPQLRNLVEGVAVLLQAKDSAVEYNYAAIQNGLNYIKGNGKLSFLSRFYARLQPSTSHYTFDGENSERLMLRYYDDLYRVRALLLERFDMEILSNLEAFPLDTDKSMAEFHTAIAQRIGANRLTSSAPEFTARYYVQRTRPFFVNGRIYYEVTFTNPIERASKYDRVIAFTDMDVSDTYAANLTLRADTIKVLGQRMPITIIQDWSVSIRPCELRYFSSIFGPAQRFDTSSPEYHGLMSYLTSSGSSLVEVMDMPDARYERIKELATARSRVPKIFPMLDQARALIRAKAPGYITLRYLLLRMRAQILKPQLSESGCKKLSGLKLQWGCIPFEEMPYCTALRHHPPKIWDLLESIDPAGREHEHLARRVRTNLDRRGMLYTPAIELEIYGDVAELIKQHNALLYTNDLHQARTLEVAGDDVFIRGYEDDLVEIITTLQDRAGSGVGGWEGAIDRWIDDSPILINDPLKDAALRSLFRDSKVAMIYGAAGTGKSTMVNYIANYFAEGRLLFLANTHSAVDNLKRRVHIGDATFNTIAAQKRRWNEPAYDLLVIDECSTVSNEDLLAVLQSTRFKLLVFVGDVHQIESILYGTWFQLMRSFLPPSAVFELTTPYRTTEKGLLDLWGKVRELKDDITETLTRGGYVANLDESLLVSKRSNEVILCLNYDGLYGINNINRFLQSANPNPPVTWGISTFKVGDPVLFNEVERFKPVIYNNLKGILVGVEVFPGRVHFEVELDRPVTELSVAGTGLQWVRDSVVAFDVFELTDSDEDVQDPTAVLPFQVAYAVSFHKAQGLEYESVKIVITAANEEQITHNVFYTAITRARESLQIYWSAETQHSVLTNLKHRKNGKDANVLAARRTLTMSGRNLVK